MAWKLYKAFFGHRICSLAEHKIQTYFNRYFIDNQLFVEKKPSVTKKADNYAPHKRNKPLSKWTVSDVCYWLSVINKGMFIEYNDIFHKHKIDGIALQYITETDLATEIGMDSLGYRKNFIHAIKQLINNENTAENENISEIKNSPQSQITSNVRNEDINVNNNNNEIRKDMINNLLSVELPAHSMYDRTISMSYHCPWSLDNIHSPFNREISQFLFSTPAANINPQNKSNSLHYEIQMDKQSLLLYGLVTDVLRCTKCMHIIHQVLLYFTFSHMSH